MSGAIIGLIFAITAYIITEKDKIKKLLKK
mgnify:CR=1 FL=1